MTDKKLELIHEQTSPLFRIMWGYNIDEPARKQFGNNICAFHIGNGYILTVAHNLRTEAGIFNSIKEEIYDSRIAPLFDKYRLEFFNHHFPLNVETRKRYLASHDSNINQSLIDALRHINFDTRWVTMSELKICTPYLIVQFRDEYFYQDRELTKKFDSNHHFQEDALNRHTYLIELELVKAFYSDDISLYRIVNTDREIINRLPTISIDYRILDDSEKNLYCIQSSSNSLLGRMTNKAVIEGYADNWSLFKDRIGGDYVMDGNRYFIKGYFRFGSSGAPYVVYDENEKQFKASAIQSEASPIQLSINKNREGNFQYVNAIASPLNNIQVELEKILHA
jgi:hypothetical protein